MKKFPEKIKQFQILRNDKVLKRHNYKKEKYVKLFWKK